MRILSAHVSSLNTWVKKKKKKKNFKLKCVNISSENDVIQERLKSVKSSKVIRDGITRGS